MGYKVYERCGEFQLILWVATRETHCRTAELCHCTMSTAPVICLIGRTLWYGMVLRGGALFGGGLIRSKSKKVRPP